MVHNIEIDTSGFDRFAELVQSTASKPVSAAIAVDGPAEAYWFVCEYGSAKGSRPWPSAGPRTVESGGRIYSSQARGGFVFKNANQFVKFLRDSYLHVQKNGQPVSGDDLVRAANEAASNALRLVIAGAPTDSGELKSDLRIVPAK